MQGAHRNAAIAYRAGVGLGPCFSSGEKVPGGKTLRRATDNLNKALDLTNKLNDYEVRSVLLFYCSTVLLFFCSSVLLFFCWSDHIYCSRVSVA